MAALNIEEDAAMPPRASEVAPQRSPSAAVSTTMTTARRAYAKAKAKALAKPDWHYDPKGKKGGKGDPKGKKGAWGGKQLVQVEPLEER